MLKIAVCDDEQSYLHDVKRLLDKYGAARGIELTATAFSLLFDLLERVESGTEFDLYLLDVYMPGMTGIELAGQLRRIGIEAPVVFPAPTPRPTSPQKASTQVIPMVSSAGMAA